MDNLMYSVASEDDIVFINETYNENIDMLHGVQRNVDVWKELMSCKDSTYYVVNAETPVAWFRIDMEDGGLWIGMLQVKPMYQHKGIGKYVFSCNIFSRRQNIFSDTFMLVHWFYLEHTYP